MKSLAGTWPAGQVSWDGKTDKGAYVEAANSYPAVLSVKDEYGNSGTFKGSYAVAGVPGEESSTIAPRRAGFSPTCKSVKNTLDLLTTIGSKASVQDWMVQVMSATTGAVKFFKGGAAEIPEYVRWDGKSVVEAMSSGFAPTGDKSNAQMDLSFEIGNLVAVDSWKVDIVGDACDAVRSFSGNGKTAPTRLSWDGKSDNGEYAPEGPYAAQLSAGYGVTFAPITAESNAFVLDLTPPTGKIGLSTDLFSLDGDGTNDTVTISPDGSSKLARIVGWSMIIYDPGNEAFFAKKGTWPASPIGWDGKGTNGDLVESASVYPIDVKLRDEFGNVDEVKRDLNTDILVLKMGDGYRIRVLSIYFKSFTVDYKNVPPNRAASNVKTLDLLAAKFAKFPECQVKFEGHAVMINWDNKAKGEAEQKAILIPLSELRAKAIKDALVERGLSSDRLVATGVGRTIRSSPTAITQTTGRTGAWSSILLNENAERYARASPNLSGGEGSIRMSK